MKRLIPAGLAALAMSATAQTPPPEAATPAAASVPVASVPETAPAAPAPTTAGSAPVVAPAPVAEAPKSAAAAIAPAPSSTPVATSAAKPETKADAAAVKEPAASEKASGGESSGVQFHPGLTFGTVTVNGQTWTRLSFQPEIEIGKLGIALDLEMFLDEKQNLSTRGWEFDNTRNTVESLLRKIYYVRWDHPGAPFYARLGALDDVTMAHGLVVNSYRNTARYPDYKYLGLHTQLNDWTSWGFDAELLVNSLEQLQQGNEVWAARGGFRPFKPIGTPIVKNLKVGIGMARDVNQYGGLRDNDRDGCPDLVDVQPDNASSCVKDMSYLIMDTTRFPSSGKVGDARDTLRKVTDLESQKVRSTFSKHSYTEVWLDASLPLIQTKFLEVGIYNELALPSKPDDSLVSSIGWGAIPLGAWMTLGPVHANAEYRYFKGPFEPGWFGSSYDIERARQIGSSVKTKSQQIYAPGASRATLQGYFVGASSDIFGMIELGADYSHMISSDTVPDERALSGKIGLGKTVLGFVKKISLAELYWHKSRIGLDYWKAPDSTLRHDGFFQKSTFNTYGWRIGSVVAPGVVLTVQRETSFTRKEDGSLKSETQMSISSQIKF